MNVYLIDLDGKLPNLALMKISAHYKAQGARVHLLRTRTAAIMKLNHIKNKDRAYCTLTFRKTRAKAASLHSQFPFIKMGGTGWSLTKTLPPEIEKLSPDYDLYTAEHIYPRLGGIMRRVTRMAKAKAIVNAGIGFSSRGCIRNCGFCVVPRKEGKLHQDTPIREIINPKSDLIFLLDNNFTADPDMLEKLKEIRERELTIEISQGIDIRLLTDEQAAALASVKHRGSIHYAWDRMRDEQKVFEGISILSKHIKPWRHMVFLLTGYDTTFEEDVYRFRCLADMKINPYIMVYQDPVAANAPTETLDHLRRKHFARWVNSRIHKVCTFADYKPWIQAQAQSLQTTLFTRETA